MYHITAIITVKGEPIRHYWNGGIAMMPGRNDAKKFTADEAIAAFPQARAGWVDAVVEIAPAAANLFEQLEAQGRASVASLIGGDELKTSFCNIMRATDVLPAGFKISDAALAYIETVRKSLAPVQHHPV